MRNIALFLTYLGTHYHGWQGQKNLPTVAETMEKAAAMVVGHPVHMTGCGRTDADYPDLEFRYCSKCAGYRCYCMDHINNHVHVTEE